MDDVHKYYFQEVIQFIKVKVDLLCIKYKFHRLIKMNVLFIRFQKCAFHLILL